MISLSSAIVFFKCPSFFDFFSKNSVNFVYVLVLHTEIPKFYTCFRSKLWWLVCAISLFRSFVFSPGVMARRQDEITPSEKTKERKNAKRNNEKTK